MRKLCTNCRIEKSASDFCKVKIGPKTRKDGLSSWCKLCYSKYFKKPEIKISRLLWEVEYMKNKKHILARRLIRKRFDGTLTRRYSHLKRSAKLKGLSLGITFIQWRRLVENKPCHYCGDPALCISGHGLDRKDNNIGYALVNVVPCCGECNFMKRSMPYHEFILLAPGLKRIKKNRKRSGVTIERKIRGLG